jgi:hypothetical protein
MSVGKFKLRVSEQAKQDAFSLLVLRRSDSMYRKVAVLIKLDSIYTEHNLAELFGLLHSTMS